MKFRKKPVTIEAYHLDGTKEACALVHAFLGYEHRTDNCPGSIEIETLEGSMIASIGDWVVRGVEGEFYPVKPGIFEKTYEKAD